MSNKVNFCKTTNDCVRRATSWSNVITIINSGQPDLHKISTHHLVDSDHVFHRSRLQGNTWSLTALPISWWYSENWFLNLGRNSFVIQLPLIPRRCLSKEFIVLWSSLISNIDSTYHTYVFHKHNVFESEPRICLCSNQFF